MLWQVGHVQQGPPLSFPKTPRTCEMDQHDGVDSVRSCEKTRARRWLAHSPSSSSFCRGSRIDSTSSSSGGPREKSAGASGGSLWAAAGAPDVTRTVMCVTICEPGARLSHNGGTEVLNHLMTILLLFKIAAPGGRTGGHFAGD